MALLLRFYCALAVSAMIRVILTKILNRGAIAVQWNGGGGVYKPAGTSITGEYYVNVIKQLKGAQYWRTKRFFLQFFLFTGTDFCCSGHFLF